MASTFSKSENGFHPDTPSPKPNHIQHGYGSWNGVTKLNNNEFINFRKRTREGGTNTVLCLNPFTSDAYHPHVFTGTKFNNVDPSAMAYIMAPV